MAPFTALVLDWAVTALWPLLGAVGMRHYSGVLFTTAGLAVGLIVLSPWLLSRGRWRLLFAREIAPSLAMMGLCSGAATVVYISALAHTTPANAAILAQVEVLYSAALTAWLLGERPSLKLGLAASLIVSGTALVTLQDLSSPRWKGDLMILCTPWLYQVSHIFAKRLPGGLDALTLSGGRVLYGIAAMAPVCLWSLAHGGRWSCSPEALAILMAQGFLMSSLNLVLWYKAIRGMELSTATTFMLSYPALTLVFSRALGHDAIQGAQILGLACSFTGAVWTARLSREARERAALDLAAAL
ncbi:MAG: DMT family transporter [Elusimicrobia bacterium]|nr:DMT family transporter [Elusimicrobiota bacterium]